MFDDRRRPLREDELARIAGAIDPRARAMRSAPILGGLDAATYALDLDVAGNRRDLVIRLFTLPEHRDGNAARRYWKAIDAIPATAPVPVPRPVLLDAEGALVGVPCMVMTRLVPWYSWIFWRPQFSTPPRVSKVELTLYLPESSAMASVIALKVEPIS